MLTLTDCIALSDLTADEVDAIAEHEHLPEILAAELGRCLVQRGDGGLEICAILRDDILAARARGDYRRSGQLQQVLRRFMARTGCDGRSGYGAGHWALPAAGRAA